VKESEAALDFSLDYCLPGKAGYQYRRPFDYFSFQLRASSAGGVESLTDRGLILGSSYEAGPALRGIWGLYGSFDYLAPQTFRISSTALSLGSTAQWWLSQSMALQVHGSAGVGVYVDRHHTQLGRQGLQLRLRTAGPAGDAPDLGECRVIRRDSPRILRRPAGEVGHGRDRSCIAGIGRADRAAAPQPCDCPQVHHVAPERLVRGLGFAVPAAGYTGHLLHVPAR
jgi:hypothetical protein